jgi:hypothetical protein
VLSHGFKAGSALRENHVGIGFDERTRRVRQCFEVARCKARINAEIPSFRPSQPFEPIAEGLHERDTFGFREPRQNAHAPYTFGLLRPRAHRPRHRRAAEKRDELASPHVRPPKSRDSILAAQTSVSIGAETGIKTIAAVHSQCRCWVIRCRPNQRQFRPLSVVSPIADKLCGAAK